MKKNYIIKKADEFNNIIKNGTMIKGKNVVLYYLPSEDNKMYYGIAAGKKLGNAVNRNYLKRKIRMIIHNNQKLFKNNYKYIIMIRRECINSLYINIEREFIDILGKVN